MRVYPAGVVVFASAIFGPAFGAEKKITFHHDVEPILQARCQGCHRPGEAAPMPLLTYGDARPWAKAIKQAVLTRKMQPWSADESVGHFRNDRRLRDDEINTPVTWADGGAPDRNGWQTRSRASRSPSLPPPPKLERPTESSQNIHAFGDSRRDGPPHAVSQAVLSAEAFGRIVQVRSTV
jgi:hypothetical protein